LLHHEHLSPLPGNVVGDGAADDAAANDEYVNCIVDNCSALLSCRLLTAYGSSQVFFVGCGLCRRRRQSPQPTEWASRRRRREVPKSYFDIFISRSRSPVCHHVHRSRLYLHREWYRQGCLGQHGSQLLFG